MHNGYCYTANGSYFFDLSIRPDMVMCVLPNSILNDGQWIGPSGEVFCPGSTSNLQCTVGSGANISVHIPDTVHLLASGDGWYKCCLPTSCSDPNTNMITANIFSKCSHCTIVHTVICY